MFSWLRNSVSNVTFNQHQHVSNVNILYTKLILIHPSKKRNDTFTYFLIPKCQCMYIVGEIRDFLCVYVNHNQWISLCFIIVLLC